MFPKTFGYITYPFLKEPIESVAKIECDGVNPLFTAFKPTNQMRDFATSSQNFCQNQSRGKWNNRTPPHQLTLFAALKSVNIYILFMPIYFNVTMLQCSPAPLGLSCWFFFCSLLSQEPTTWQCAACGVPQVPSASQQLLREKPSTLVFYPSIHPSVMIVRS